MIVGAAGWGRWARCTRPRRRSILLRWTSSSRCPDCDRLSEVLDSEAVERRGKTGQFFKPKTELNSCRRNNFFSEYTACCDLEYKD